MRTPVERELSSHFAALRALARDLVGESDADDLVQETALQALRRPPGEPGPMSGWLRLVVRRLAGRHRRATRRRAEREQQVARDEVLPPPQGQFEHREQLQRVTAAVLALPEPYQRTVLLRYLEELTPTAIARATACRWRR
jgi:RNA polymerase sigma factor (sigma-70 family)